MQDSKTTKKIKSTKEINVPSKIIDKVIGQEQAIELIKKAAKQRRHILLIGEPGTGKSMLGQALAELLPEENLPDILSTPNYIDENNPKIQVLKKGQARPIIEREKIKTLSSNKKQSIIFFILAIIAIITPWYVRQIYGDILAAASLIGSMMFLATVVIFMNLNKRIQTKFKIPKILIDNSEAKKAPFNDATGAHAGALLGDVLHDPLQCYPSVTNIHIVNQTRNNLLQLQKKQTSSEINNLLKKHNHELIKQNDYRATFLDKGELTILGEKDNTIQPINVLSVNKHPSKHKHLIQITTQSGKTITTTPEHKIAVKKGNKTIYKPANKLTKKDKLITFD